MDTQLPAGPYRATILWNGLIRNFRSDIPLGRHRRYMKTYDECFVASEAVEWLHQYLKNNPNFGTGVSRAQTIQLLQKLHRAKVFEDVRGSKHNHGDFADNARLFRLTLASPGKTVRTPIALRNNLKLANLKRSPKSKEKPGIEPVKLDFTKISSMPTLSDEKSTLPECHFVSKPLSTEEIEKVWKAITLQSLQNILGVDSLGHIIDDKLVSGKHIMHNCQYVNKSGVVTNIDSKDQLPYWALSAMKCLAYWPDKTDDNLPDYPGFEKDVFHVVKDYFCGLPEPLMTHNMYEVITNVFVQAKHQLKNQHHRSSNTVHEWPNSTPKSVITFKSVENLLMSISSKGSSKPTSECQDASEGYSSSNILDLSPIPHEPEPGHFRRESRRSGDLHSVTRYETAFGPDNNTVTRVFYADGIATDYNHDDNGEDVENIQQVPIETHFDSSPEERTSSFSRKNALRHSVNNLFNRATSVRHKKTRKDKNAAKRRSVGSNCNNDKSYGSNMGVSNNDKSYGCSVGVYSRTMSDTSCEDFVSQPTRAPPHRSMSVKGHNVSSGKPPKYGGQSRGSKSVSHDNSNSNKTCQPVINGTKNLRRKKSLSSASLNHTRKSVGDERELSGRGEELHASKKNRSAEKTELEPISARSLSMSDLAMAPPIENDLQKQCMLKVNESEDSVFVEEGADSRIVQALQLVLLLIPPASRRRLHLLLRLMSKISTNEKLILDESQPSRNLLLETFYRAVLTSQDESDMDDMLVIQLVAFLMDHYMEVLTVPASLKTTVEQRINKLQRTKIRYSSAENNSSQHFCEQVTLAEYENQKLTSSQQAIVSLLDNIINDKNMAVKEKRKRLKQFQKMYPDIYRKKFPTSSKSESELSTSQPKIKPPLLAKPLLKLKGLRL